jgi:hypothetical protein
MELQPEFQWNVSDRLDALIIGSGGIAAGYEAHIDML